MSGLLDGTQQQISNQALITSISRQSISLSGTIAGGGTVAGDLYLAGNTLLKGNIGGVPGRPINLGIEFNQPAATLTNQGQITGAGFISANNKISILNDVAGQITINQAAESLELYFKILTNRGLIEASNGGMLRISPGFQGSFVNDRTMRAASGQVDVRIAGDTSFTNNSLVEATSQGTISIFSSGIGTFTNNGTLRSNAGSIIDVNTLTNYDSVNARLTGGIYEAHGAGAVVKLPGDVRTLAAAAVLDGPGARLANYYTDESATAHLARIGFDGSLRLTNGHTLETDTAVFENFGALKIDNQSNLNIAGLYLQEAGTLDITDAASKLQAGSILIRGGTLKGQGRIITPELVIAAASVQPGNSPGLLVLESNTTLAATTDFEIELAGTILGMSYDSLTVIGSLNLAGAELDVTLIDGFWQTIRPEDSFTIVNTQDGLTGIFAGLLNNQRFETSDGLGTFAIHYSANSVVLNNFVGNPVPEPGVLAMIASAAIGMLILRQKNRNSAVVALSPNDDSAN